MPLKKASIISILFLLLNISSSAQIVIHMQKEGGVYTVPCSVNGIKLKFIFDTGASDVTLSLTEAIFMLKNGYIDEKDIIGTEYYKIANGEITKGTKIILRKIEFGGFILHDVEASIVHELSAPLLLGQSVISQLGKITIDPQNNTLAISAKSIDKSNNNPSIQKQKNTSSSNNQKKKINQNKLDSLKRNTVDDEKLYLNEVLTQVKNITDDTKYTYSEVEYFNKVNELIKNKSYAEALTLSKYYLVHFSEKPQPYSLLRKSAVALDLDTTKGTALPELFFSNFFLRKNVESNSQQIFQNYYYMLIYYGDKTKDYLKALITLDKMEDVAFNNEARDFVTKTKKDFELMIGFSK